ncbi:hypothetical protein [Thalassoroseus pseudoceratinae]|uniref:hypothetical protein n=1 Tax=Thalassoroseus pseudoceratinae TaxID=2713176 RepID=UPI00141DFE55|nr:hypothetical protein [Thalassoroseus pseudoceratinae]
MTDNTQTPPQSSFWRHFPGFLAFAGLMSVVVLGISACIVTASAMAYVQTYSRVHPEVSSVFLLVEPPTHLDSQAEVVPVTLRPAPFLPSDTATVHFEILEGQHLLAGFPSSVRIHADQPTTLAKLKLSNTPTSHQVERLLRVRVRCDHPNVICQPEDWQVRVPPVPLHRLSPVTIELTGPPIVEESASHIAVRVRALELANDRVLKLQLATSADGLISPQTRQLEFTGRKSEHEVRFRIHRRPSQMEEIVFEVTPLTQQPIHSNGLAVRLSPQAAPMPSKPVPLPTQPFQIQLSETRSTNDADEVRLSVRGADLPPGKTTIVQIKHNSKWLRPTSQEVQLTSDQTTGQTSFNIIDRPAISPETVAFVSESSQTHRAGRVSVEIAPQAFPTDDVLVVILDSHGFQDFNSALKRKGSTLDAELTAFVESAGADISQTVILRPDADAIAWSSGESLGGDESYSLSQIREAFNDLQTWLQAREVRAPLLVIWSHPYGLRLNQGQSIPYPHVESAPMRLVWARPSKSAFTDIPDQWKKRSTNAQAFGYIQAPAFSQALLNTLKTALDEMRHP